MGSGWKVSDGKMDGMIQPENNSHHYFVTTTEIGSRFKS